jgi:hypothetical protein
MAPKAVLERWIALRGEEGIERARRTVTYLSVVAFGLTLVVALCATLTDWPAWALLLPAAAVGWLVAERNALQSRVEQWPALSEYLDWRMIQRDWEEGEGK